VLAPHWYSHFRVDVSHLPCLPAIVGQSLSPQQPPAVMHWPLQSIMPDTQRDLHFNVASSQVVALPAWAGQSLSAQHSPHLSPQDFPVEQVNPQRPLSQVAVPPGGAAHGAQDDGPHELTLASSAQIPPQS
jgi:hypothetical protein